VDGRTAELLEHHAVCRLQAGYGDAVSRRAWREVAAMFAPEAVVSLDLRGSVRELVGGDQVAGFIAGSVERFEMFEFAVLNAVVDVGPSLDLATGRMYIWEIRQEPGGPWTNAFGCYDDEYELVDGHWRFSSRRYATVARSQADGPPLPPLQVFGVPGAAPT
jgi:hypothetical protein